MSDLIEGGPIFANYITEKIKSYIKYRDEEIESLKKELDDNRCMLCDRLDWVQYYCKNHDCNNHICEDCHGNRTFIKNEFTKYYRECESELKETICVNCIKTFKPK